MALYAPRRSPRRRTTLVLPPPRQPVSARFNAIRHRVESILRVPPHLISGALRDELVRRAERGADVRAWSQWTPPFTVARWYLWDGEMVDPHMIAPGCIVLLGSEPI